jgi:hypothetical protein
MNAQGFIKKQQVGSEMPFKKQDNSCSRKKKKQDNSTVLKITVLEKCAITSYYHNNKMNIQFINKIAGNITSELAFSQDIGQ